MDVNSSNSSIANRRGFIKRAGASLTAGFISASAAAAQSAAAPDPISHAGAQRPLTDKEKVARIASNTWPIRYIFKARAVIMAPKPEVEQMKKKYGEITMLDFPEFTKQTFPGVRDMDLFSGLFGDPDDERQFVKSTIVGSDGSTHEITEFDPSSAAGKRWLEKMANKQVVTGTRCHHISNNAPRNICDLNPENENKACRLQSNGSTVPGSWARNPCASTAAVRASLHRRLRIPVLIQKIPNSRGI